ncbi:IS66 family transposase [Mycetohabitans sp. B46]|uniref:IS66 family transposase n=1 Tax=Mycetohabitans sp. B46 TaxID=2772536 RepID=UPI003FCF979C
MLLEQAAALRERDAQVAKLQQRVDSQEAALASRAAEIEHLKLLYALAQIRYEPRDSLRANRWTALTRYCDDGRLEIDNLLVELALREVAIGRRNYLFAGADSGGERAAAIYSVIGTTKLNNIDSEGYLREVLACIAEHPINRVDELLPLNFSFATTSLDPAACSSQSLFVADQLR